MKTSSTLPRQSSFNRVLVMIAVVLFALASSSTFADEPTAQVVEETKQASVRPGINDSFLKSDLDVLEWIARFEMESREVFSARETVLKEMKIEPGFEVADIGAGTGFYSRLMAQAVGKEGQVYSVDIAPKFLEHINYKAREDNVQNLTTVLCTDRSVELPPDSIDFAFICDTYHHFEYPQQTLASIRGALRDGGTLVIIDFDRIPGKSREFILGHVRAGKKVFQAEVEEAGFEFVEEVEIPGFEENYFLRFRRN